jgi:nitroreductase
MSPPWGPRPVPPRVHLLLFVHRVDGLTPGLYALPRRADALPELQEVLREEFQWQTPEECPPHLPLYRLMEADARKSALLLACRQLIAGGGAFSPAMLGEFEHALEAGPWGYRRLMTEAGLIGEALYLGAEASGLQGTGIGRFFDDGLHELFGLRDRRYQVLYQFTVGKGRPDSRIGSEAAYPEFRGQEIQPPAASRGRRRKHGLRKLNRGLLLPPHTSSVRGEASLEMGLLAAPRAAAWRLVDDESILAWYVLQESHQPPRGVRPRAARSRGRRPVGPVRPRRVDALLHYPAWAGPRRPRPDAHGGDEEHSAWPCF